MAQQCTTNSPIPPYCSTQPTSSLTYVESYCVSASSTFLTCTQPSDPAISITLVTGNCWWCSPVNTNGGTVASTASTTTAKTTATTTTATTTATTTTATTTTTAPTSLTTTSSSSALSAFTSPSTSKSSTTSATSSTANTGSRAKLTTRAGVGIGLGCALAGALLAGVIAFVLFCRKRRKQSYPQPQPPFNGVEYVGQEKYGIVATEREVRGTTATNFERLLPLPAEDDAIIGGLSKIRDSIKNHVQNYYHTGPISPEGVDELRLAELSQATGIPTSALLNLLFNPATRFPTIRLFLGHLILSRLQGRIDGQASFLPNEVSLLAASQSSASANSSQALLFSKWKTISGVLLQPKYGEAPGESDVRNGNIAQILAAAEPVLHPFINPNTDTNARQHHLEGIMRRAAQFAFLLFSQPGSFSFDFRGPGEASSLLVFPVFLQTVSDEAEILSPPRLLSGGEVLSGLGM